MAQTLRKGIRGAEVRQLQELLNRHLPTRDHLQVDGIFGPATETAVRQYQGSEGLTVDGVAGPRTRNSLERAATPKVVLRYGSKGSDVRVLQELLNAHLEPSPKLSVDGIFGRGTRAAVTRYQASVELGIDGVVGPKTWAALASGRTGRTTAASKGPLTHPKAPWMAVARREEGQSEIPGKQHNPRIVAYHATTTYRAKTDEVPWCSSFVNWVLRKSGVAGTDSAAAASWLKWGRAVSPRTGAIAVLYNENVASSLSSSGNHVGFLIQETDRYYKVLGGNQSNTVKVSHYPKSSWRVKGYRWPAN